MAAPPQSRNKLSALFAHPAALILLTAALTGLLAPWITNRWTAREKQIEARRLDNQRELDVKARIVNNIGTTSAAFLNAVETNQIPGRNQVAAYRAMKVASLQVGSQLAAYFHEENRTEMSLVQRDWAAYAYNLRNTYQLLIAPDGSARNEWLGRINSYLNIPPSNFRAFRPLCRENSPGFQANLRFFVLKFQDQEQRIVGDVAASPTVLTGTPSPFIGQQRYRYRRGQQTPCHRS